MRFLLPLICALAALHPSIARAQSETPRSRVIEFASPEPERRPAPERDHDDPAEAANLLEESESLSLEEEPAPARPRPAPACAALPGQAAAIGVWPSARESLGACAARAALAPFAAQSALLIARELWCSDPAGAKAAARQAALLEASSSPAPAAPSPARPSAAPASSFLRWDFPLARPARSGSAPSPGAPRAPASRPASLPAALDWDAREAQVCASWKQGPAELSVAVSAVASGRARLGGRDCPALLAQARVISGRFAGAQAPLLVGLSECSGLSNPTRLSLSSALSSEALARAWSAELLQGASWQGPPPPAPAGPGSFQ